MKPSQQIKDEIERRKKGIDDAIKKLGDINIDLIAEAFPQGYWFFGVFNDFEFSLPFSFELIESFKAFMEMQYPKCRLKRESRHIWEENNKAGHFLYYDGFEVSYRTERTGTTCVLNKIGETSKTVPIYEVICQDGANE